MSHAIGGVYVGIRWNIEGVAASGTVGLLACFRQTACFVIKCMTTDQGMYVHTWSATATSIQTKAEAHGSNVALDA